MVQIPEPLRVVFDAFPLKSYPAIPNNVQLSSEIRHFRSTENASSTDESFTLAVHNLQLVTLHDGTRRYIPTDPTGLSTAMVLCDKHNLKLPDGSGSSVHSMMPLSNTASPDNELPMLIETKKSSPNSLIQASQIQGSIVAKNFAGASSEYLFNQLLDSFQDLWIFVLLSDFPQNDFKAMSKLFYRDPEITNEDKFDYVTLLRYMLAIPSWNKFKERHSHLFHESFATKWSPSRLNSETFMEILSIDERKSLETAYFAKLSEFDRAVPLLLKHFSSMEDSDAKRIMTYKFASFFVCVKHFVPKSTHISRLVRFRLQEATKFSEETLAQF